jgi:hypothetical protein
MTMKKLMLATAVSLCLTIPAFAQDNGQGNGQNNTDGNGQQASTGVDLTERPLPDGFQPNGSKDNMTWTSTWTKSTSSDGTCTWHVRVNYVITESLPGGKTVENTDWEEYSVKVPCDETHPYLTGVIEPPIEYVTPGPQLGGGDPPPPPSSCPGRDDWVKLTVGADINDVTYYFKDGTVIRCRDGKIVMLLPPAYHVSTNEEKAEQTAREIQKILEQDPETRKDIANGGGQFPAKPKTDAKTDSKVESKTDTNPEHSTRTVTPEKTNPAKQVARAEARQTSNRAADNAASVAAIANIASIAVMGFGGGMHMGGMHMGGMDHGGMDHGMGGMHMGGMDHGMGGGMGGMHGRM